MFCRLIYLHFVCIVLLPHLTCTFFPYTTLFRSLRKASSARRWSSRLAKPIWGTSRRPARGSGTSPRPVADAAGHSRTLSSSLIRSEEHTSELQSRENLVCRLLLETKNNKHYTLV